MAGRKATPTHMRLLRGNPGKRALNPAEPKPERGVPDCPDHLSDRAKAAFHRVAGDLDRMGVLTKADGLALELLVLAYDEYRTADDAIRRAAELKIFEGRQPVDMVDGIIYETTTESGDRMIRAHPANALRAEAWRRVRSMLAEFGLTPASRTKVSVVGEGEADPLAQFLGRRGGSKA